MSSSDSEQFESADESYDDDKNQKSENNYMKTIKNIKDLNPELNTQPVEKDSDKIKTISEKPLILDTDISVDESLNKSSILTKENEKLDDQNEKDGGWDVEDWGGDDNNDNNTITKQTSLAVESSKQKKKDDANGGWDDFDDNWEDFDNEDNKNIKTSSEANQFIRTPVEQKSEYLKSNAHEDKELSVVFDKLTKQSDETNHTSSWGSWTPWGGVVSFLTTASEGVASITTNVTKGISNVIESGIGVPDPVELAKQQKEESKRLKERNINYDNTNESDKSLNLGNIVSNNLGNIVTEISNRVISGGLDTLEGIGKKTMNMLQENDPGLTNKKKMLGIDTERPILSQVLREAKQKSEETEKNLKLIKKNLYRKKIHFESLFDDYHGLVHLEALEMLSKQATINLQCLIVPLSGKALEDLQETLAEVTELCELPDIDDESDGLHLPSELSEKLKAATEDLDVPLNFSDILKCWDDNTIWLDNNDEKTSQEIHDKAIHCLAQTTALAVHKMHKLAEVLLLLDHHSTANEADSLVQLTTILSWHLSGVATRFSNKIGENGLNDEINNFITSIFLEGSNSTSYIQKTFQLFIPILQVGAA